MKRKAKALVVVFVIGIAVLGIVWNIYIPDCITTELNYSEISSIVVESAKGQRRELSTDDELNYLADGKVSILCQKSDFGLGKKGYTYSVRVLRKNGKKEGYLIRSKEYIQYHGFNYKVAKGDMKGLMDRCENVLNQE